MKKIVLSLLLLLLLVPGHLLAQCMVEDIVIGNSVPGEWDAGCESENQAGSYAQYYTFSLVSTQEVTIDLASSKDTVLFLLSGSDEFGAVIESNDNISSANSNSNIIRTLEPGSYTVEATTAEPAVTGSFLLSVIPTTIPAEDCTNSIETNTSTDGIWEQSCTSTNGQGKYAKYYTFKLSSEQQVTISLDSNEDSYLYLLEGEGTTGDVIDQNDDGGGGSDAEIFLILEAGTYTIEATTFAKAVTGIFVLTLDAEAVSCDDCEFPINAGLNDAWFNPATDGQGMNITVYPKIKQVFVTWFTFDTERPPSDDTAMLGGPGQRWLTAQGPYDGDTAVLTIYVTEGGVFDSATPPATTDEDGDGTLTLEVSGCNEILASYDITSLDISDEIPLERIVLDNIELCEMLTDP